MFILWQILILIYPQQRREVEKFCTMMHLHLIRHYAAAAVLDYISWFHPKESPYHLPTSCQSYWSIMIASRVPLLVTFLADKQAKEKYRIGEENLLVSTLTSLINGYLAQDGKSTLPAVLQDGIFNLLHENQQVGRMEFVS